MYHEQRMFKHADLHQTPQQNASHPGKQCSVGEAVVNASSFLSLVDDSLTSQQRTRRSTGKAGW